MVGDASLGLLSIAKLTNDSAAESMFMREWSIPAQSARLLFEQLVKYEANSIVSVWAVVPPSPSCWNRASSSMPCEDSLRRYPGRSIAIDGACDCDAPGVERADWDSVRSNCSIRLSRRT